nr:hypothetical protein BgiMline_010050 [Biomphalaria glabrata]
MKIHYSSRRHYSASRRDFDINSMVSSRLKVDQDNSSECREDTCGLLQVCFVAGQEGMGQCGDAPHPVTVDTRSR